MLQIPIFWRKQKHCNVTKVSQRESNPNGCSPESCLTLGGRIVNWPATNLQSSIWSQDCTSNPVLHPPQHSAVAVAVAVSMSPAMYAGLSEPQVCCDPLGSDKALTLGWRQQVEVLGKAKVFGKATLPSGVRVHCFLNKPSHVCSLNCTAAGLLPALAVVTGLRKTCQASHARRETCVLDSCLRLWYVRQRRGSAAGDTSRATAVQKSFHASLKM